jgi:2-oxoglutarate dehydrogenase complex dihydrolipoamide succinyltransferase (E2) component
MPTQILMPQLGESIDEGTIVRWLKKEGDPVQEFEPILEITTDKVDTEVTAPADGVLLKVLVTEGTVARAGTVLGWVGPAGEAGQAGADSGGAPASVPTPAAATASSDAAEPRTLGFISPVVARLAAEHNVNLSAVKGTGLGGRITKKDVLAFVESRQAVPSNGNKVEPAVQPLPAPSASPAAQASGDTLVPLNPMRRSIAEHMVRSKHIAPHVTTVFEADLSRVAAHREANKAPFARDGVNLTFTAYFVAAACAALKAYPLVNSSFAEDKILVRREINIGLAVSLGDDGLIVPVLRRVDEKSLLAIARQVNDLAGRARARQLKPDEVQGGTFTLTNHGVSGSLFATPIINQPQCGILGVGVIQKRAVVVNDAIAIRPMVYLSLTFDHRVLDGATADFFLARVKETLETWP